MAESPAILPAMLLGGMGILKLVQTFWGFAVLVGLGGYSLYQAAQPSELQLTSSAPDSEAVVGQLLPSQTPTPHRTPIGGYPTPAPLTIFLACDGTDGDSVRYYVHAPGGYIVLRLDVDRDIVLTLLRGEPTQFPAGAIQVQTPCMRGHIRAGRLP